MQFASFRSGLNNVFLNNDEVKSLYKKKIDLLQKDCSYVDFIFESIWKMKDSNVNYLYNYLDEECAIIINSTDCLKGKTNSEIEQKLGVPNQREYLQGKLVLFYRFANHKEFYGTAPYMLLFYFNESKEVESVYFSAFRIPKL